VERHDRHVQRGAALSKQPVILIVEDDYFLQIDLEQTLSEAGFATETASSGEEALTRFAGDTKKYKALMTDIRLNGGLNGWDVARHFRAMEPALPVIYVTGSSAEDWASHRVPNSILVQKPFARGQLVSAVSNLFAVASTR
jgi:DNA-binding NtrC family response regulator